MEQEQEKERTVARLLMFVQRDSFKPDWTSGLLLVPLLFACGQGAGVSLPPPDFEQTVAWVGESEHGLKVVAEPVYRHLMSVEDALDEAVMLQAQLKLPKAVSLMRLHLVGAAEALTASGELSCAGSEFKPLLRPEDLTPRGLNLWLGLVDGGPAPALGTQSRRSFLLQVDKEIEVDTLHWKGADISLDLRQRTWKGRERQVFLSPKPIEVNNE